MVTRLNLRKRYSWNSFPCRLSSVIPCPPPFQLLIRIIHNEWTFLFSLLYEYGFSSESYQTGERGTLEISLQDLTTYFWFCLFMQCRSLKVVFALVNRPAPHNPRPHSASAQTTFHSPCFLRPRAAFATERPRHAGEGDVVESRPLPTVLVTMEPAY